MECLRERCSARRSDRVLGTRTAPAGELITAETRLIDLANLWITGLEAEGRIEATTINEYRRVLDNLVLPSLGGLKLREATTGRLDRLLLRLRDQSVNRQRKAEVVLGAMLDLAVRHDAIPTNPARGTSGVHRPAGDEGPAGRGPGRDPRCRTPVGERRSTRAEGDERHGRHHRPDACHRLPDRRDPGVALERPKSRRGSATLSVSWTIKTETGKGTYRKATPKTDTSRRTVVLPRFAADRLRVRREFATPNEHDAVFATRNGTWHQVVNVERRWRQIRKDTGYEWVTPHTFRKTVATLISEATTSELASRQLGHSSSQVTRDHFIAKPPVSADLSELLERLAESDDPSADS